MSNPKSKVTDLRLSLKTKWFEMTKDDVKPEDYREINEYWIRRLIKLTDEEVKVSDVEYYLKGGELDPFKNDNFEIKQFQTNTLTLGYPSANDTDRIIQFEHAGIEIRTGNPEWGAEPNKLYFVIKHGKRIL